MLPATKGKFSAKAGRLKAKGRGGLLRSKVGHNATRIAKLAARQRVGNFRRRPAAKAAAKAVKAGATTATIDTGEAGAVGGDGDSHQGR